MELFNIENPFYEKWRPGRPSFEALAKREKYWEYEKGNIKAAPPEKIIVDHNFQTPIPVCKYMVKLIPEHAKTILEPSPGLGNILSCLSGYEVTAAEDFFLLEKKQFDCIVMNPPFSSKTGFLKNAPPGIEGMKLGYYFLTECMKMSDHIIALMPWFTITDSCVRLRMLKDFGLKSLTSLPRKTFQYARIQTVIIELEKGFCGQTIFNTFDF